MVQIQNLIPSFHIATFFSKLPSHVANFIVLNKAQYAHDVVLTSM